MFLDDTTHVGVALAGRHLGPQPVGFLPRHERLGIAALLHAVLDRGKTCLGLVLGAAFNDGNTAEPLFGRAAHKLK